MNISTKDIDNNLTVHIDGKINTSSSDEFEEKVNQILSMNAKSITIDCSGLTYISSSGLRVFLLLQQSCDSKGTKLYLKSLHHSIKNIFKITGFNALFTIID